MTRPKKWHAEDIPRLSGRTFVVTGATSGLGFASALALARHGGQVVVTGRDPARLQTAFEAVRKAATDTPPTSIELDLASLSSVREAAAEITESFLKIDVLLNNAGVMATPRRSTEDGFELQIGTNHLGHFALTGLLLPVIPHSPATQSRSAGGGPKGSDAKADSASNRDGSPTDRQDHVEPGRVVTVASIAHKNGKVVVDDLSFERRSYSPMTAYGQSKLANLLFTEELAHRARAAGSDLIAAAAHPGLSATNLFRAGPTLAKNPIVRAGNRAVELVVSQSAADGALPSLYAATAPDVVSGDYYGPDGLMEIRGTPTRAYRSPASKDAKLAADLWRKSEELTGVRYDFKA